MPELGGPHAGEDAAARADIQHIPALPGRRSSAIRQPWVEACSPEPSQAGIQRQRNAAIGGAGLHMGGADEEAAADFLLGKASTVRASQPSDPPSVSASAAPHVRKPGGQGQGGL